MHDQHVGNNGYMAYIADLFCISAAARFVRVKDTAAVTRPWTTHEKATVVEALIGAVAADSGEDSVAVKEFARSLFVCYPEDEQDDYVMRQAKKSWEERRAVEMGLRSKMYS